MNSKFFRGILYSSLGMTAEIFYTSLRTFPKLEGRTQLWVAPLYYFGSIYGFEPLYQRIYTYPLYIRCIIYALFIMSIEYVAGILLKRLLGVCPWEYRNRRFSVQGVVNLAYLPLWSIVGLLAEQFYQKIFYI